MVVCPVILLTALLYNQLYNDTAQKEKALEDQGLKCKIGGEGGIRTHGTFQYA
jgi:hypothetical protein